MDSIISEHFKIVRHELALASERFSIAEHKGIKGYGREALARNFLKSHIPNMTDFFTGEIIDRNNDRSSQMDLIVYAAHCPRLPLIDDFHLAFIDAVMASIEVKSDLNAAEFIKCMKASKRLKKLRRDEFILGLNDTHEQFNKLKSENNLIRVLDENGIKIEFRPEERKTNLKTTPYIVFAYKGATKETLMECIEKWQLDDTVNNSYDQHGPDLIINLERGFYIYKNNDWLWPKSHVSTGLPYGVWEADREDRKGEVLAGLYMLLSNLSTAFLLRPPIVNLPDYFATSNSEL